MRVSPYYNKSRFYTPVKMIFFSIMPSPFCVTNNIQEIVPNDLYCFYCPAALILIK